MIITELFMAKDSLCDYCNDPLVDGEYVALNGYTLLFKNSNRALRMPGPFVPCNRCSTILELPSINLGAILKLHKIVAVKYRISPSYISIEVD